MTAGLGLKESLITFLTNKKAIIGLVIVLFFLTIGAFAPYLAPYKPMSTEFPTWLGPSRQHLLGTTDLGQDLLSQFIWGARLSLLVGISVSFLVQIIALSVGVTAGYYGGWIGNVLTTFTNVFLILPTFPLMIVIAAFLGARGSSTIILVLVITSWAWGARVFRSQTLSLKERGFIEAAKVAGERDFRIIFGELIPNMFPLIVSNFIGTTSFAVITESALRFIGLGSVNEVTWGTMLFWASNALALAQDAWWWFIPPGLSIALFGLGLALINFAIDEVSNPRLRKV
ncbi:MAG: ABC transporter permease [Candidatus Bipolaricaulia bacterium]